MSVAGALELRPLANAAVALPGAATALAALYLVGLAGAAFRHHERAAAAHSHRLLVLVPAHDEEALIGRCVASLRAQDYPPELVEVVVVADNCSDRTAGIARAAGCSVLERDAPDERGKGRALRWAMDRVLRERPGVDAVVVVDADSVADPGLLSGLEAHLAAGAAAVQGEYLVLGEGDGRAELRAAAFRLFHVTRFAGRAALGMPCALVGNGMLLSRELLERHPWSAFTSAEDLEFSMDLRLAGIRPAFAASARVQAPAAARGSAGRTQRARWEGGRFHVMRTRLPALVAAAVRRRDWRLLDTAVDLAVPPLGLLVLVSTMGTAVAVAAVWLGAVSTWAAGPWVATLGLVPVYVLVGLRAAHAPASTYRALLQTPLFLAAKLGTYATMARSGLQADRWQRTERPVAVPVAGVPDGHDAASG